MDTHTLTQLLEKVRNGEATKEEKILALEQLNVSAEELNQLLKDLLAAANKS